DLGARQHEARFVVVGDEILVARLAVLGNQLAAVVFLGRHGLLAGLIRLPWLAAGRPRRAPHRRPSGTTPRSAPSAAAYPPRTARDGLRRISPDPGWLRRTTRHATASGGPAA